MAAKGNEIVKQRKDKKEKMAKTSANGWCKGIESGNIIAAPTYTSANGYNKC